VIRSESPHPQRTVAGRNVTTFGRAIPLVQTLVHVLVAHIGEKYAVIMGAVRGESPKSGHSELRQGLVHPCSDDSRKFHVRSPSKDVRATSSRSSFAGRQHPTKRRSIGVRTGPHSNVLLRWQENQVRKVPMKMKINVRAVQRYT